MNYFSVCVNIIVILTGNEISKHYDNCHKIFDKQGFFHQEVNI